MKIIASYERITKINKICKCYGIIKQNHENLKNSKQETRNHENLRILFKNQENHENLRIRFKNQ